MRGATCTAYATEENTDTGGSRFVGPVQLRGARGRVWLHGRRVPTWWLWTHAGGRIAGILGKALWWLLYWRSDGWMVPPPETNDEVGDLWTTYKTGRETVSWPIADSLLVSCLPLAHSRVSNIEAALPSLMGVRGVSIDMAAEALEKARRPGNRIRLEVPLGRRGGMAQLHLDVSGEQRDAVLKVLRGTETASAL